jgi:heme-degrading monooxygenase HmoA
VPTLINLFEEPQAEDDEFVAAWERARDFMAERGAYASTALHKSLESEAVFRFVNVAEVQLERWHEALSDPEFPRDVPGRSNPSLYEIAVEDEASEAGGVVLINPFHVPKGDDEEFRSGWERARDALRDQEGYLGTRLYRTIADDARFRFVNVAPWRSPQHFMTAIQSEDFQRASAEIPYKAHPALYQVVST